MADQNIVSKNTTPAIKAKELPTISTGSNIELSKRMKLVESFSEPHTIANIHNAPSNDLVQDPVESLGLDNLSASGMLRREVFRKFVNDVADKDSKAEKKSLLTRLENGELSMEEAWKLKKCKKENAPCKVPNNVKAKSSLYEMADENGSIDLKKTLSADDGHSFLGKVELSINAKGDGATAGIKVKF